jgi:hypothetical protein
VRFPDLKLARKWKQCGRTPLRERIDTAAQRTLVLSTHSNLVHSLFVKSGNRPVHLQSSFTGAGCWLRAINMSLRQITIYLPGIRQARFHAGAKPRTRATRGVGLPQHQHPQKRAALIVTEPLGYTGIAG